MLRRPIHSKIEVVAPEEEEEDLPPLISLLIVPCVTVSSSVSSARSSAHFTVRITCPPNAKSPNSSWATLISYLLTNLNTV
jgi:hypothetical protein